MGNNLDRGELKIVAWALTWALALSASPAAAKDPDPWTYVDLLGGPRDVRSVLFDPGDASTLYVASRSGLFTSQDGGSTWDAATAGLNHWEISALALVPSRPGHLFAGTQRGGVFHSSNGGRSWSRTHEGPPHFTASVLAVDPEDADLVLAGTAGGSLLRSDDAGARWTEIESWPGGALRALTAHPSRSGTYFASGSAGLHTSHDGGLTWTSLGADLAKRIFYSLSVDPEDPRFLYAGSSDAIYKVSTTGGTHQRLEATLGGGPVTGVAVGPGPGSVLFAGTRRGGVLSSADGGKNWTRRSRDLGTGTVWSLGFDRREPPSLYAATEIGLFRHRGPFRGEEDVHRRCPAGSSLFAEECSAAVALLNRLDTGAGQRPPCSDTRIRCRQGHVVGLFLGRTRGALEGPFPEEIRDLPRLEELQLYESGLTGTLPAWIGELSHLRTLHLGKNLLTDEIPPEIAALAQLEELNLGYNHLEGPLPDWIGRLESLRSLVLAGNRLEGAIPESWESLQGLETLSLADNRIGTEFPAVLSGLARLHHLDLARTGLRGPIPPSIGALKHLRHFDLRQNWLDGSPPSALEELGSLRHLDFSRNRLRGPLTFDVSRLRLLEWLDVSSNPLEGPLPSSLPSLGNLSSLAFGETSLCEPQDPVFQSWLDRLRSSRRTLRPCLAPRLDELGKISVEVGRAALDQVRIRVDWTLESLDPSTRVGLLRRFELTLEEAPSDGVLQPTDSLGEQGVRSTCLVQSTLPVAGEARLLTVLHCGGFERIPYTFALWEPTAAGTLRIHALSRILLFAAIGRIEVESVVPLAGGDVLLQGTHRGGDIESWASVWVGLLRPPTDFALLFEEGAHGSVKLDHFFDPHTLELVLRRRDESLRDEPHDGVDWPPTEEVHVDVGALLRRRGPG